MPTGEWTWNRATDLSPPVSCLQHLQYNNITNQDGKIASEGSGRGKGGGLELIPKPRTRDGLCSSLVLTCRGVSTYTRPRGRVLRLKVPFTPTCDCLSERRDRWLEKESTWVVDGKGVRIGPQKPWDANTNKNKSGPSGGEEKEGFDWFEIEIYTWAGDCRNGISPM
jgi:hypothetical protein